MTVCSGSFWFVVVNLTLCILNNQITLIYQCSLSMCWGCENGWQVVGSLFFWLAEHSIQAIIIIDLEVCDICVISTTGLLCGVFDSWRWQSVTTFPLGSSQYGRLQYQLHYCVCCSHCHFCAAHRLAAWSQPLVLCLRFSHTFPILFLPERKTVAMW